ncbi:MAG: Rrf2 family transcriptional regulator [Ruminococcus sp.]|nr:Rrf2 family transcriptional regulator [Ruminococcus sp.]
MLISTKGRYALRILVDMAEHKGNGYIKLKDIAERQGISEKYLESIVKQLVINHIVVGLRGKGGGYRLNKEPDAINVGEVLRFMEGSLAPVACLEDGGEPCPRVSKCRTVGFWRGLDETIRRYTDSFTVADLMRADNSGYDYVI